MRVFVFDFQLSFDGSDGYGYFVFVYCFVLSCISAYVDCKLLRVFC